LLLVVLWFSLAGTTAAAHATVNARELEVLVLRDEKSDVQTSLSGYDLGDFFLAEAWMPGLGDGFYIHTILFGGFPGKPPGKEFKVEFTMTPTEGAPVKRFLSTTDGAKFSTDFDLLQAKVEGDQVEVGRAFVSFASSGLHAGSTIKSFLVRSLVDDELRDQAPGGIYLAGTGGRVEIPAQGSSSQVVPSFSLAGPRKYATASFGHGAADGQWRVTIRSLLTKGAQHVHLEVPEWSSDAPADAGWKFGIEGESGGEVAANGAKTISFTLVPHPDGSGRVAPRLLNVTTDLGGRLGFQIRPTPEGVAFVPQGTANDWGPVALAKSGAPAAGFGVPVFCAGLAAVLFLARRRVG
jgi:hypothetical protein